MGSYLFKWEHPANEVYVTGTFDDWSKSQKLNKVGTHFEKVVPLSKIDKNIYYKFVVDDNWVTNHTGPQETDESGNTNNVLRPEHIKKDVVHNTDSGSAGLPGAFPETPAAEEQMFGISPIAASTGVGNPMSVQPGNPLPISTKSVNDNVTLDKASYDNAGSSTAPQLPDVVTPERERVSKGGMFGLGTTSGASTMIPGSGLAMGAAAGIAGIAGAAATAIASPFISSHGPSSTTSQLAGQVPHEPRGLPFMSSAGPTSTTANLAGQVPLESSHVPEMVEKSQEAAHFSPEASANPEAVAEKSAVEKELQSKVPEAPATATGNTFSGKAVGIAAGLTASATAAVAGAAAYVTSSKTGQDIKSTLPVSAQGKIDDLAKSSNGAASSGLASSGLGSSGLGSSGLGSSGLGSGGIAPSGTASSGTPIAPTVPDTVQESISKAHASPEAAANSEAVQEKSAVESELLNKVHSGSSSNAFAPTVPDTVQKSIVKSHMSPEAAANPEAVEEKSAVESELLKKVHTEQSAGEPAPTTTAATTDTAPGATTSSPSIGMTGSTSAATTESAPPISTSAIKTESASPLATQSALGGSTDPVPTTNTSNTKAVVAGVAGGLGLTAGMGAALAAIASQSTSSATPTKSVTSASDTLAASKSTMDTLAGTTASTKPVTSASDSLAAPTSTSAPLGRDITAATSITPASDSLAAPKSTLDTLGSSATQAKSITSASDGIAASSSAANALGSSSMLPAKSTSLVADGLAASSAAAGTLGSAATPIKPAAATSNSLAAPTTSTDSTPGRDPNRRTIDSRDVSPMTRGPNDTAAPMVTTGVASAPTQTLSTPQKPAALPVIASSSNPIASSSSTTASPSSAKTSDSPATADKKKNRRSGFFGRIKDKLEHRKDKNSTA